MPMLRSPAWRPTTDIERGFRVLKSEIEIGPVCHRRPDRIKAHASISFIALILYQVMRHGLQAADARTSPEKTLAQLCRIQHHRITCRRAFKTDQSIN